MKANILLAVVALVFFGLNPAVHAEDGKAPESHEQHHPQGNDSAKPAEPGMMNQMSADEMKGTMHDCMSMHKDGKMCDHEAMEKCKEKMGSGECKKMMKQAKGKVKSRK